MSKEKTEEARKCFLNDHIYIILKLCEISYQIIFVKNYTQSNMIHFSFHSKF